MSVESVARFQEEFLPLPIEKLGASFLLDDLHILVEVPLYLVSSHGFIYFAECIPLSTLNHAARTDDI